MAIDRSLDTYLTTPATNRYTSTIANKDKPTLPETIARVSATNRQALPSNTMNPRHPPYIT